MPGLLNSALEWLPTPQQPGKPCDFSRHFFRTSFRTQAQARPQATLGTSHPSTPATWASREHQPLPWGVWTHLPGAEARAPPPSSELLPSGDPSCLGTSGDHEVESCFYFFYFLMTKKVLRPWASGEVGGSGRLPGTRPLLWPHRAGTGGGEGGTRPHLCLQRPPQQRHDARMVAEKGVLHSQLQDQGSF